MAGSIVMAFSGILMMLLGYLVDKKKMYWLISGYNMMSAEKKKKVDIRGLAKFLAKNMYFMGMIFLVAAFFIYLENEFFTLALIFLIFPQTIYILVRAQSFDPGAFKPDGSYKTSVKIVIGFILLSFIGILFLIYLSLVPAVFEVKEQYLDIKGMYGQKVYYSEIRDIYLSETRPEIIRRANGSSIAEIRKGRFELEDDQMALLFLEDGSPPYLFIQKSNDLIIVNSSEEGKVADLYSEIMKRLK